MQRERVAKSDARQRAAEIRADGEAQLATIFQADDARWAEAVKVAQAAIDAANVTIDRHCDRDQPTTHRQRPTTNQPSTWRRSSRTSPPLKTRCNG